MKSSPARLLPWIICAMLCLGCGGADPLTNPSVLPATDPDPLCSCGPSIPRGSMSASPTGEILADGVSEVEIEVSIQDGEGRPMIGISLEFLSDTEEVTFSPSQYASTEVGGKASVTATSTAAGEASIYVVASREVNEAIGFELNISGITVSFIDP